MFLLLDKNISYAKINTIITDDICKYYNITSLNINFIDNMNWRYHTKTNEDIIFHTYKIDNSYNFYVEGPDNFINFLYNNLLTKK
jgi:hypothetical protein